MARYLCSGEGLSINKDFKDYKNIKYKFTDHETVKFTVELELEETNENDIIDKAEWYVWKIGIVNPIVDDVKIID